MIYNQKTINILNNVFKKYPERFKDACDSLNENQQRSKHWLVEKLNEYKDDWSGKNLKTGINVSVLTSWYGMMAYILINDFKLNKITFYNDNNHIICLKKKSWQHNYLYPHIRRPLK